MPKNQTVLDVEGMTAQDVLNGGKKPTPTETSTETVTEVPTDTDATEPEKTGGCKSAVSSAAVVAIGVFLPVLSAVAYSEKKRKRK